MKYGYIYKITNNDGQIYIGQTIQCKIRWKHYEGLHCKSQKLLYKSLKGKGYNNHTIEIVYRFENSTKEILDKFEIFFIKFFNSYYYDNKNYGLNLTRGGDTKCKYQNKKISKANKGIKHTEETKKRIGDANRGKSRPDWIIEKLIDINRTRIRSIEELERRRQRQLKYRASEETKKKQSESKKGHIVSQETRDKLSKYWTGYKWDKDRNKKISIRHTGSGNGRAILNEDIVYQIKECMYNKVKRGDIFKRFGISESIYSGIRQGKNWQSVKYPKEEII